MNIYFKIHNYNLIYNLQKTLYIICHKVQLPEIYLKYIKVKTKAELIHFYIIPIVYKNP